MIISDAKTAFGLSDPTDQWAALDADAGVSRSGTYQIKSIGEAKLPPLSDDPNELLKVRYLCRGGGMIIVGPSGIGKSAFMMQVMLSWSVGKPILGLQPARPLKILLIQAENDDGDLAEAREGVIAGLLESGIFSNEEAKQARDSVKYITVDDVTGSDVAELIEEYGDGMDMVVLDPLFAYCGCSVSDQENMSRFLRNELNPVIHRLGIGLVIVHHTNKPPKKGEKGNWGVNEESYDGSGTAELINWARAALILKSIGDPTRFRLVAAKRGQRLGWVDPDGEKMRERYIRHGDKGICWLEMSTDEISELKAQKPGSQAAKKVDLSELLQWCHVEVMSRAWKKSDLRAHVIESKGISASYYDRNVKGWLADRDGLIERNVRLGSKNCYLIGPPGAIDELTDQLLHNFQESQDGNDADS